MQRMLWVGMLLLAGCFAPLEEPPAVGEGARSARVYVALSASGFTDIIWDDRKIARLTRGEFTRFDVEEGSHSLSLEPSLRLVFDLREYYLPAMTVEARPGGSYYYEVSETLFGFLRIDRLSSSEGVDVILGGMYAPVGPRR